MSPVKMWTHATLWPFTKRWDALKCHLGFHQWEDCPNWLPDGTPDNWKPGLNQRCARPGCRIFRDKPLLTVVNDPETGKPKWYEVSDQFMAIARANCHKCRGTGAARKMLLPAPEGFKVTAKIPCECIRVQPRFVCREKS